MGRPSDKKRSALRLGKRERARVKTRGGRESSGYVGGVAEYHITAGRKKHRKVSAFVNRVIEAHLAGDLTLKSMREVKRPLYTIKLRPLL